MGRLKTFAVESALDQAIVLFRRRGYHNTSMQAIADHLGLSRSSLYTTFIDKHNLFEQALRHYGASCRGPGLPELADAAAPRAALLQVFELAIAAGGTRSEPCLLINTALEPTPLTPGIAAVLDAAFEDFVTRFREAIERAQDAHEIAADVDPVQTARALLGLYLGLCVLVRNGARIPVLRAVLLQVQVLLPENGGA